MHHSRSRFSQIQFGNLQLGIQAGQLGLKVVQKLTLQTESMAGAGQIQPMHLNFVLGKQRFGREFQRQAVHRYTRPQMVGIQTAPVSQFFQLVILPLGMGLEVHCAPQNNQIRHTGRITCQIWQICTGPFCIQAGLTGPNIQTSQSVQIAQAAAQAGRKVEMLLIRHLAFDPR